MGPTQFIVSGVISLIVYSIALFAIYKIFQISTDVSEIKGLLREMKRNTQDFPAAVQPLDPQSPEALVRAVHASYETLRDK